MRYVSTLNEQHDVETATSDALAAACLFGIVGGLLFAVAIIPTIAAVTLGGAIGAGIGIVVAYH